VDPADMAPKMKALRMVGVPYTDAEIAKAAEEVKGKTEMDALIAYLQVLGTAPASDGGGAMDINDLRALTTVFSSWCFLGIVVWVGPSRRRAGFRRGRPSCPS
jgi:hypothetical protein